MTDLAPDVRDRLVGSARDAIERVFVLAGINDADDPGDWALIDDAATVAVDVLVPLIAEARPANTTDPMVQELRRAIRALTAERDRDRAEIHRLGLVVQTQAAKLRGARPR